MSYENTRKEAREALKHAHLAARREDLAAAERWSKTAERMAVAAEKLAALPAPANDPEEEERLREELRVRITRFAQKHNVVNAWEREAFAYEEALTRGETPPPLAPHPNGPIEEHDARVRIRDIVAGRLGADALETPLPQLSWDENGKLYK